ncbi:MAG: ABC transporter substrate-binding protein [Aquamicrobium sp.]|uniref:heme/hemin ABC transporter substrate-binding protein n=1 Tax=Aquamicrobium sp. TaxID=1872579 RepID=UPI00349E56F7|nr:ABC transporter substrate-binding protein [Aquamicrobium sp.]
MTSSKWLRAAASGLAAAGFAGLSLLGAAWAGDEGYDTSRVVSVGGSLTEIVYALGEEEHLVARDSTSVFPAEANELPDIGYMRALSPEGVLSINPSVIILLEGSGPPETLEVLGKASVPLVTVPDRFDREGIVQKIGIVGDVLGVADRAEKLAAEVSADIDAARALTADVKDRKKVLFVLSLQGGRVLASGTGTAADGIIGMAGGVNAVTGYSGYKQLSDEALIEAAPDVILVMDRGGDHQTQAGELLAHPAIAATPAAANKKVVRMDGAFLLGFGPRTAAAARELAGALYGDAIGAH